EGPDLRCAIAHRGILGFRARSSRSRPGMTVVEVAPYTPGLGSPAMAQAARSVLTNRHATVIWPTPPGTGVIAPATFKASAKATSPTRRVLPSTPGKRLIPTSITVAPG